MARLFVPSGVLALVALALVACTASAGGPGASTPLRTPASAPTSAPTSGARASTSSSTAVTSAGPSAPPARPYQPMSARRADRTLHALRRAGWQCFASLSTPIQVDRCFLHPGPSTSDLRAIVWLVHVRSRANGGGPLHSAEIYAFGGGRGDRYGENTADRAASILGTTLLGGQGAALQNTEDLATIHGIHVRRTQPARIELVDSHVQVKAYPSPTRLAGTSAVQANLSRTLPGWRCHYASDFYCRGSVAGSHTLLIHTDRQGTKAGIWTVGLDGHPRPSDAAPRLIRDEIAAFAAAGIVSDRQRRYLLAHVGRSLDADIDGRNLGLQVVPDGPVLVVEPITTSF